MKASKLTLLAGFLLLLSGCNPFIVARPDSEKLVTSGWARHPDAQKQQEPLYCYGTLADKVCYTTPKTGAEKRLSGFYGPKP